MFERRKHLAERQEAERKQNREIARRAAYKAPAGTAQLIVELGQERLKALQAGATALDARTTQVAAFQLAAAGFCAGLATAQHSLAAATLALSGCCAFVVGSALAFLGMHACTTQAAGLDPSFWRAVLTTRPFTDKIARSWAAECTEDCIQHARAVDEKRARWLNWSLLVGAGGALAVVLAVGVAVWDKRSDGHPRPASVHSYLRLAASSRHRRKAFPLQEGFSAQMIQAHVYRRLEA